MKNRLKVIGLMSGTSLDGVDIALCSFQYTNNQWTFDIEATDCIPYPTVWTEKMIALENASGVELQKANGAYGTYLGQLVKQFLHEKNVSADFVASHGHTLYHLPQQGMTYQLGSGAHLAAASGLPVVCDFRTGDLALGGEGAPLVPIGDQLLFREQDICLNLGGIANLSRMENGKLLAYDICPVNLVLNHLSSLLGHPFDEGGNLARKGQVNNTLLAQLNALSYYITPPPKSLGKEWVLEAVIPLLNEFNGSLQDAIRTFTEHIAIQLSANFGVEPLPKVLVTGGGAKNTFLMERVAALANIELKTPESVIIDYKEALIFAFLGALRWRGEINVLASVTGATRDHCSGAIYLP